MDSWTGILVLVALWGVGPIGYYCAWKKGIFPKASKLDIEKKK